MAAGKRQLINKTFSLLRGTILGRLKIYRAGPAKDLCVSLELELAPWAPEPRKQSAAPTEA